MANHSTNKFLIEFKYISEFDRSKNIGIDPEKVGFKSSKKVWWICPNGHSYDARVYSRTSGTGCRYCAGKEVCDENSLAINYPKLISEWSNKNKKSIYEYTQMSNKKVWWVCNKGHLWEMTIANRTNGGQGCPECSGRKVGQDNCLANINPELAKQWSYKNTLSPKNVTTCSGVKVWWVCDDGHEWKATVANRTNGFGCPKCSGNEVSEKNSLKINFPLIAKEYDHNKNNVKIEKLSFGSNKKVWWICPNGHSYEALVSSRTGGTGCRFCVTGQVSSVSQRWLDEMKVTDREHIIKANGKIFKVDGFDNKNNTIYEFYGDFWHGNPKKYRSNDINPINKNTFGKLYKDTINREDELKKLGFNLVTIWESDYEVDDGIPG